MNKNKHKDTYFFFVDWWMIECEKPRLWLIVFGGFVRHYGGVGSGDIGEGCWVEESGVQPE